MAEKVFSQKVGRTVRPGEYLTVPIDGALLHEAFAFSGMKMMKAGVDKVWDPKKVVVLFDHYVPAPTERMAAAHMMIRQLVDSAGIEYFYGEREGVGHQVMMEMGHVHPGALIVGTDSHTCTYGAPGVAATGIGTTEMAYVLARGELYFRVPETIRIELKDDLPPRVAPKDIILSIASRFGTEMALYQAIEYSGDGASNLSMDGRMTICNMSVELGAKFGFFEADERALDYLEGRLQDKPQPLAADPGAEYKSTEEIELGNLEPLVACPHSVGNVKPAKELQGTTIQQAVLGSCTNGRIEDLQAAAEILKGHSVAPSTRMYVYPASRRIYLEAVRTGLVEILSEAGAIICNPGCGPCFGAHLGLLGPGEAGISSTNRNFKGRMGSAEAEIYLASPATVAASAILGTITDPREV
jgi:3-isopropylmalate/(R)-2-methylmalate dehydratase large subunit